VPERYWRILNIRINVCSLNLTKRDYSCPKERWSLISCDYYLQGHKNDDKLIFLGGGRGSGELKKASRLIVQTFVFFVLFHSTATF
jgi:hypothetical protein